MSFWEDTWDEGPEESPVTTGWMGLEYLVGSRGHRPVQDQPRDSGSWGSGTVSLEEFICKIFFFQEVKGDH